MTNEKLCEKSNDTARSLGLDILRIIAFLCVISIHFFTRTGYGTLQNDGFAVYIVICLRYITRMCIPLFLMLSGYLLANKEPNKKYYLKIIRILVEYFIASIVCVLFSIFYLKEDKWNFVSFIRGVFSFSCVPYSWYINMYIGLFLIAPFINKILKNITKKQQQIFLIIMIGLTLLPTVVYYYFSNYENFLIALPSFWYYPLYMLTYFFAGQYIRINQPKVKRWVLILVFIVDLLIAGIHQYTNVTMHPMDMLEEYYTIFVFILTVSTFLFFYDLKYKHKWAVKVVSVISISTLSGYMISWVFDSIFYEMLFKYVGTTFRQVVLYAPIIVLLVSIYSLIYGIIITFIISLSKKGYQKLESKFKEKARTKTEEANEIN